MRALKARAAEPSIILSHVSDDRLPAIADVHMLHSDILVPAVA
jgi:hypothetical protein